MALKNLTSSGEGTHGRSRSLTNGLPKVLSGTSTAEIFSLERSRVGALDEIFDVAPFRYRVTNAQNRRAGKRAQVDEMMPIPPLRATDASMQYTAPTSPGPASYGRCF